MLGGDNMQNMTWASILTQGNKNILEILNWISFVIMKKRLLVVGNLFKNTRRGNQKIKKGQSRKLEATDKTRGGLIHNPSSISSISVVENPQHQGAQQGVWTKRWEPKPIAPTFFQIPPCQIPKLVCDGGGSGKF